MPGYPHSPWMSRRARSRRTCWTCDGSSRIQTGGRAHMTRLLCFGVRVELFSPWHPFEHEVLRRACEREFDGRRLRVHTPEDLIVYNRVFNRSKDIEDIKAILAAQAGSLDLGRIRAAAAQLLAEASARELDDLIRQFYR